MRIDEDVSEILRDPFFLGHPIYSFKNQAQNTEHRTRDISSEGKAMFLSVNEVQSFCMPMNVCNVVEA